MQNVDLPADVEMTIFLTEDAPNILPVFLEQMCNIDFFIGLFARERRVQLFTNRDMFKTTIQFKILSNVNIMLTVRRPSSIDSWNSSS